MSPTFLKPDRRLSLLVSPDLAVTLPDQMQRRIDTALAALQPSIIEEVHQRIAEIYGQVNGASDLSDRDLDTIHAHAHELRGICGTVGMPVPGGIADALCAYIEDLRASGLFPRANIVWLHITSLKRAAEEDDAAPAIGTYLIDSLRALRTKELKAGMPDADPQDQE